MPVTPDFTLRQDDEFVFLDVRVPYVRISDLEYVVEGQDVSFYVKPYLLQLQLPGRVMDDERAKAVYDPTVANGMVYLKLPKETKGEDFPDLDLLTKLRRPKVQRSNMATPQHSQASLEEERNLLDRLIEGESILGRDLGAQRASKPLIQVLSSQEFDDKDSVDDKSNVRNDVKNPEMNNCMNASEKNNCMNASEKDNDMNAEKSKNNDDKSDGERTMAKRTEENDGTESLREMLSSTSLNDQTKGVSLDRETLMIDEDEPHVVLHKPRYGFNRSMEQFFGSLMYDFPELIDLVEPDETPESKRRELRIEAENEDFDVERYLGDYFYGQEDPVYVESIAFKPLASESFTKEEQEQMRDLQNKEFLEFSPEEQQETLCAILDVVIAAAYDSRTTQGDPTVESPWTIRKLSATLSWLDRFQTPLEVGGAALHRMLAYPYLRRVDLSCAVLSDAKNTFEQGKRAVLKILLGVHKMLSRSEQFYLLNRLYITDMCVWLQHCDAVVFQAFANVVRSDLDRVVQNPFAFLRWDIEDLPAECQQLEQGE